MPSLFTELRRRNVFKVGAAYAIVAWLLLQITDIVLPTFNAPQWVAQTITFLLIIGFPIAVLLAWAYEMTPEGIKAAADVPSDSITPATGQRLNYVILGLVVLAVGFLVTDQYVLDQGIRASVVGTSRSIVPPTPTLSTPSAQVRRYRINLGSTQPLGNTGLSAHIALSSDARHLVYAAQRDGQAQLYLRALDQLEARPMAGTAGAYHPFFSPDGEWVVFFSDATDQKLKRVSIRGGPPLTLADAARSGGGFWDLDDTLVYATGIGDRSLFRISATGGVPEPLIRSDAERGYVRPGRLPSGDAVLLVVRPERQGGGNARDGSIAVLSLTTREYRTIIERGYAPQYAPTGHVVFVRGGSLWAVPFDEEQMEITGPEVPVVEAVQQDGFTGSAAYAFSDDGMLVYAPGGDVNLSGNITRLVWVDRQGREELLAAEPRPYLQIRLSPDGRRLAASIGAGGNVDIWIYDLERGTSSRLTFDPAIDDRPVWTPDGERVVFSSARSGSGMFWKAADGTGQVERLTIGTNIQRPESFSPDGTRLVFREEAQQSDLHVLSMEGEISSQPLLQTDFDEDESAISPDGRWIVYVSNETGRREAYVRPFPNFDDGKWQISRDGAADPLWGPDSSELFYVNYNDGAVMAVSVETEPDFSAGNPRALFFGSYALLGANFPSYGVSPDGQHFLLMKVVEPSGPVSGLTQLVVVENWFEELNRLAPPSP